MRIINRFGKLGLLSLLCSAVAATSLIAPVPVSAQVLEEVIVTAQRREQTLQEVPISVSVYSGAEIALQGYKRMDELAKFSASVNILDNSNRSNVTIRGFGTTAGSSQTLISATPVFVDGIHYGADEMIKNAFLDTERVEVLKGPQPLYFGMNATAGAFNIITKRPTPEWEGDVAAEYGNDGQQSLEAAFGGPITDTLGIRVASIYEKNDGQLKSRIDGSKFPAFDNLGGRVTLEWTPTDKLTVLTKFDISRLHTGVVANAGCLTEGDVKGFPDDTPLAGDVQENVDLGNERSVNALPPSGVTAGPGLGLLYFPTRGSGQDCFNDKFGFDRGDGGFIASPVTVNEENSALGGGAIFPLNAINIYAGREGPGGPGDNGADNNGAKGGQDIDSWNALLDITYELDNGININSQTAMVDFLKNSSSDNTDSPFLMNFNGRQIDMEQMSQLVRVTSPGEGFDLGMDVPGGVNMEFMVGGLWQTWQRDTFNSSLRSNVRRSQRFNKAWEDAEWFSGFFNLTFNFMDRQLAIEAGARYTDVSKDTFLRGKGAQWIFEGIPCDSEGTDADPATCTADPDFKWINPELTTFTSYDPSNAAQTVTEFEGISEVRVDSPIILADGVDTDNLWAPKAYRDTVDVPLNYRSPAGTVPIGLTAPVFNRIRAGPWGPCASCISPIDQDENNIDTQVVVRFTPNAWGGDHTFYGKYAEAFKGPSTDTGQSTIPGTLADIEFEPEYSTSWEIGAKGRLLDGRMRYDISAFMSKFKDLQLTGEAVAFDPTEQQSLALNAGMDVNGLEFSLSTAVTEELTVNFAGALLDPEFKELDGGGCGDDELLAPAVDAVFNNGGQIGHTPSAAELTFANELLANMGPTRVGILEQRAGSIPKEYFINGGCRLEDETVTIDGEDFVVGPEQTIDRSGATPAFAPGWKFILGFNYTRPITDEFDIFLNAKGFIADESLLTNAVLDRKVMYNSGHHDVNISGGFGPRDGSWRVIGFVRNLFEDKPSYNPEYDLQLQGFITAGRESEVRGLPASVFRSYGVRLEYYYR